MHSDLQMFTHCWSVNKVHFCLHCFRREGRAADRGGLVLINGAFELCAVL